MKIGFTKRLFLVAAACMVMAVSGCNEQTAVNTIHSLDDLQGKKIGVQLKTTGDVYASDIEDAEVVRFNRGIDAATALKKGVVDAVIIDDAPAKVFIDEVQGLTLLDEPFAEEEYGIAVNKNNPALLADINEALAKLQNDGTLDSIKDAWIMGEVTDTAYEGQNKDSYANGILTMITNAEFPPYESMTQDGKIVGIDVDIMKAICDELDMELKVQNTTFDSVIVSVERGMSSVAVSGITITQDRLEQVDFSEPYAKEKQVVIVREERSEK
jgi:ABC-type amino acid transport/signal transduction systems, periplasmic component/domain